jgi:hypothetical protein
MPREAALVRLTALIHALPNERAIDISATIAADLVALLLLGKAPKTRSSDTLFAPIDVRQRQILIALSAFAIMVLIVFVISAVFSL